MSDTKKPFACTEKNCSMSFANEDHLNVHRRRHSISFNLEFANKNAEIALTGDQTPTPTSFFRNCEEVGLFQDLQNVNPFDETFKKALENSENGSVRLGAVPAVTMDDTLNTPQIFPIEEESLNKTAVIDDHDISNLVELPNLSENSGIITAVDSSENIVENQENVRHTTTETLPRRNEFEILNLGSEKLNLLVSTNSVDEKEPNTVATGNTVQKKTINIVIDNGIEHSSQKIREMNRAAQMRFRKRKKLNYDKMASDNKILKEDNEYLRKENARLKQILLSFRKIIEDLGGSSYLNTVVNSYGEILSNRTDKVLPKLSSLPLLAPAIRAPNGCKVPVIAAKTSQPIVKPTNQNESPLIRTTTIQPVLIPVQLIRTSSFPYSVTADTVVVKKVKIAGKSIKKS